MITVVIADDQAVVRAGLRMILEANGIQVLGEAADGAAAIELAQQLDPDVMLMDIRMPSVDGIEATGAISGARLRTRILVLTTYGVDQNVHDALKAGASGFLLKTDAPERLVEAVRAVAAGETPLAADVTSLLIDHYLGRSSLEAAPGAVADLTPREVDVLTLIARGKSNAEIASHLYVGEGTVKTHVARILAKLDLRDRTQAAIYAYEHGVVRPGYPL
jgi:DNA-binding NarL/FixJ family response regulator